MNRRFTLTLLLVLAALPLRAPAQESELAGLVPGDVHMVLHLRSLGELQQVMANHPFGRLYAEPQMKRFLAPMLARLEALQVQQQLEQQLGLSPEELQQLFEHELMLVLPNLRQFNVTVAGEPIEANPGDHGAPPPAVDNGYLMLRTGELGQALLKFLDEADQNGFNDVFTNTEEDEVRWRRERIGGNEVRLAEVFRAGEKVDQTAFALVNGVFVATSPGAHMEQLLPGIAAGGQRQPLERNPHFQRVRAEADAYYALFYINLEALLAPRLQEWKQQADEPVVPMLGITRASWLRALAPEVFQAAYMSMHLQPAFTTANVGLHFSEARGLATFLDIKPADLPRPDWIPEDIVDLNLAHVDVGATWQDIKTMMSTLSPVLGSMLNMRLRQLSTQTGVDIEQGLIGNAGDHLLILGDFAQAAAGTTPKAPEPDLGGGAQVLETDAVVALKLKDAQGFRQAWEGLLQAAGQNGGLFTYREYLGTQIATLKPALTANLPPGFGSVHIAFRDTYMLLGIGRSRMVESVLQHMAGTARGNFWAQPRVQKGLRALPPRPTWMVWKDDKKTMGEVVSRLKTVLSQLNQQLGGAPDDLWVDFDQVPDADVVAQYFDMSVNGLYRTDYGVRVLLHSLHPAP